MFTPENTHLNVRFVEAALHASMVSRSDRSGNITYVNRNFEKVSGYSREELVGQTYAMVNSGVHPPTFWEEMWHTINHGNIWHKEVCNRARDGVLYWVDAFVYPYLNEDGELIEFFSIHTDITQSKHQQQALAKSNIFLQAILNSTNDIYFLLSPDRKLLNINDAGKRNLTEFWNKKVGEDYETAIVNAYDSSMGAWNDFNRALMGEIVELEVELVRTADNEKIWHHVRQVAVYDEHGLIVGVSIVLSNIHDRKLQELRLQESEMLYRAILNSMNDIYFLLSPQLKLLRVNQLGLKLLEQHWGITTVQEIEQQIRGLFELQPATREAVARALKGEEIALETKIVRPDGTAVWCWINNLPVYDDDRNIIGVSVVLTNIHTRKMQELEIEAKNQALTEIAWSQSHEMRRPVASILGLLQLRLAQVPMISHDEFMTHLNTMTNELDLIIRKNVERTYRTSQ